MKYVIVEGVAAGASAAARLRRLDEKAEIMLIEKCEASSCANCGLPYHVGGVIKDRARLTVMSKEKFASRFNVDVRTGCEATAIDRQKKTVTVAVDAAPCPRSELAKAAGLAHKSSIDAADEEHVFHTDITFVRLDENGVKRTIDG